MSNNTITKFSIIIIILFSFVVFTTAGPNSDTDKKTFVGFDCAKIMIDFKMMIAKDLAWIGLTADLGLTALSPTQVRAKSSLIPPPPPPIVVTNIQDTYVQEDTEDENFGGRNIMEVEHHVGANQDRRGLVKIDLSAYNCVIVESATLYMYLEGDENEGVIVDAFAVTSEWNEGTGNGNNGAVNWNERINGTDWTNAGGDYDPALLGTMTTEALGYRALSLDVNTVQSWINDPNSNNGIILLGRLDNLRRPAFTTMEGAAAQRPYLELTLREACCANGIDDDGDGDIDNVDGDCGGYSSVSTDTPIVIPNDQTSTITSTITVAEYGIVTDINVLALDILHDYIGDISITLTSPSGTVVQLRSNGCASNDNLYLNFDDSGLPYTAIGCPPVDAVNAYQAFGNLNDFNGEEVHGDWTLTVDDNYATDGGTFLSWTLQYFLGTSTGMCENGIDEDGDGFTDSIDPDCDCGTNYVLTSASGEGISTTGSIGVTNASNAVGAPDNNFAQLYESSDRLLIELTEELGAGGTYTVYIKKKSIYNSATNSYIIIEESDDNVTFTQNPQQPTTNTYNTFTAIDVTANVNTKYLRIRYGFVGMDFDAVVYDSEYCELMPFEICGNGLDDDNDGLIDDADPDCGECTACFTPIVSEFLIPFPEDQVFTALETIYPGDASCGISTGSGGVQAPIFSYISVSAFLDGTILFYDHWEDGFEAEASNPTQSTTEIWGDGNLSNGFPPNHPTDIIDAGSILILNNPIDPTTLGSVLDFDGGDAISSSYPLSVTRAAWAEGTKTLLAGALEVFSTESWGTYYEIPFGVDVDTAYNYFDYTGFVVMSASDNNSIQIDADANGTYETTITLNKGQSYQANGGVMAGARINATEKVQVDVITGDICDNFESRWFTLPPEEQWEDNYYSPMSDATQVYVVYNPNNTPLTVKVNISGGTLSDVVVPANSTGRFVAAANTGHHLYSSDGSDFYAVVLNDGVDTIDDENSLADWGAALIPQSRLTQQVVVGWAPGQDPTQAQSENGSPIWVTAFYPPASQDIGSGDITVCIDYDGDGQGPLTDSYGRNYDTSISLADLGNAKVYDPDGNQTNMVLYICDGKEALLSVVWGQENGVASAASPGLDVGTGVPGLNPFFAYKTVTLTGDVDNDGQFSLGDTIQYSIGIQNPGLVPVTGNYLVEDIFPNDLNYIQNSTFIDDGTNQMTITDAGTSDFPLDEGGVTLGISLEPRAEAVVSFSARIISIPPVDSLITNYATVTKDGIKYEPKVTIKVNPASEICDNLIDDDLDGFIDCDCETEDNIIRGIVFNDVNANAANDAENGIQPVIVNVYNDVNGDGVLDDGDTQFNTTTTTAEGAYEFAVSGTKIEQRIAATADDAEQDISNLGGGGTTTNNSDLDLGFGYEGFFDKSIVGLRYSNLAVPPGAVITNAYIEFTANSSESGGCNMDIYIEATDNAVAYQSTFQNLSNRTVYNSLVDWDGVPNWVDNQTYQTPDLSSIIQLVIDRPGWNSGQAISFEIVGTDRREAYSFEDDPNKAPKLVINYAFFPSNYIVEIDTTSVQSISAGAYFTTPITQAITFGDPDAFVCDANFGIFYQEICDNNIDDDFDGLIDAQDPDCLTCPTGSISYQRWTGIGGNDISTLTNLSTFPNSPDFETTFTSFDAPDNAADNFGSRIIGHLHPQETGAYTFILTSDDQSELYLSTNSQQINKQLIASVSGWTGAAQFDKFPEQTSVSINLVAGQTYFIEAIHKEGGGGDHLQVYWQTPSNSTATIIDGAFLSPYGCEICDDGIDNDGDGQTDCLDGECETPSLNLSGDTAICSGESVTITATATNGSGGYIYQWSDGLGNGTTKTITPPSGGSSDLTTTYSVTVTGSNGCEDIATIDITAYGIPVAEAGNNINICAGETVNLNASATGGDGNYSYTWNNGLGNGSSHNFIGVAPNTSNSTTNYTVTVTDGNGCTHTDIVQVRVYSNPDVTITSTANPHCGQSDGLITVSFPDNTNRTNIKFSIDNGATYPYSTNDNVGTYTISNLVAGNYNLWVRWGNNACPVNLGPVSLSNIAGPEIVLSIDNSNICEGESVNLSATATGGDGSYSFVWNNGLGSGTDKTVTPPFSSSQNTTTTYSVTVTDGVGCTAVGTTDVTAESLPAATVNFSDEFCNQGNGFIVFTFDDHPDQTQLDFSIDGGNTYPYTVQDNNGTFAISNLSAGTYDPWIRWGNGACPVDLPDVTLGNTGGPSVTITGPTSVCEGEQAQITAQATGGTSPYLYTWDNGLGNGATKTVYPTTTTTYSVTATDNKGCTDTDNIQITVLTATDPACSDCPNPADDDGDGICESEDCDDNDPNIPAPPGTACDDGNDKTINDVIQADECTCAGDPLPCDINFGVTIDQPIYNNNGTDSNLSDDTFTFDVLITGDGTTWTANGQSGAYGTTATFGPFSVDASGISFDIVDTDNSNCRENISVNIASCIYSGVCTCCE